MGTMRVSSNSGSLTSETPLPTLPTCHKLVNGGFALFRRVDTYSVPNGVRHTSDGLYSNVSPLWLRLRCCTQETYAAESIRQL